MISSALQVSLIPSLGKWGCCEGWWAYCQRGQQIRLIRAICPQIPGGKLGNLMISTVLKKTFVCSFHSPVVGVCKGYSYMSSALTGALAKMTWLSTTTGSVHTDHTPRWNSVAWKTSANLLWESGALLCIPLQVGLAGYFAQAFSSIASTCGALGPQHLWEQAHLQPTAGISWYQFFTDTFRTWMGWECGVHKGKQDSKHAHLRVHFGFMCCGFIQQISGNTRKHQQTLTHLIKTFSASQQLPSSPFHGYHEHEHISSLYLSRSWLIAWSASLIWGNVEFVCLAPISSRISNFFGVGMAVSMSTDVAETRQSELPRALSITIQRPKAAEGSL